MAARPRARRSPLYDFDENSKLQRPGKEDIGAPFIQKNGSQSCSNRLITSTVLGIPRRYTFFYSVFLSSPERKLSNYLMKACHGKSMTDEFENF